VWSGFSDSRKAEFLNAVLLSVFCFLQIKLTILKCHAVDVFATGDHSQHGVVTANLHLGWLGKRDIKIHLYERDGKEI